MCMHDSTLGCRPSLSLSQIADLRLAASQLSGPKRRAFEAEMALKYCGGPPLERGHLCVRPSLPGPTLAQTWLERRPLDIPDAPMAVPASRAQRSQGRQTAVARTKTH
jgi:hypothetical protein